MRFHNGSGCLIVSVLTARPAISFAVPTLFRGQNFGVNAPPAGNTLLSTIHYAPLRVAFLLSERSLLMKFFLLFAVLPMAFTTALIAAPAHAQTFQTSLSGSQQSPVVSSPATGFGTVRLDAGGPTGERLFVTETVSGLTSGLTEFHIHGPAAAGTNGPVLYNIATPESDPLELLGKTSFSISNFEIDLPGVATASNGSVFTQGQQVTFLDTGLDYLNIHTTNFPSGEIRGQISSPAAVPEANSVISFGLLLTLGSLMTLRHMARRRKVVLA